MGLMWDGVMKCVQILDISEDWESCNRRYDGWDLYREMGEERNDSTMWVWEDGQIEFQANTPNLDLNKA